MQVFKLRPAFKDYIWGGNRLATDFGKKSNLKRVAESWELSCHDDGLSVIEGGEHDGLSLKDYVARSGKQVLGKNCDKFDDFPILIKLIDAKDNLSVQVHPDDEYAREVEGGFGKTEMWYVVDCDKDAQLIYGFTQDISKEEFAHAIKENTLLELTNSVKVKPGDVFFIEAGTLHAIGAGILIAEIQQSSNLTYRVYDYGRMGDDGKPRQLHIDKAVDVTTLSPTKRPIGAQGETSICEGNASTMLASCEFFTVTKLEIKTEKALKLSSNSFNSLLCIAGNAQVVYKGGAVKIAKGESLFIPALLQEHSEEYKIIGECEILLTSV